MRSADRISYSGIPVLRGNSQGFALIAALLAILILTATGILAIAISTQDIRISSRIVGERKALSAAENGVHHLSQNFNPDNLAASAVSNVQVNAATDPDSRYSIGTPAPPSSGPAAIPLPGYSISGGQQWGQVRYAGAVTGTNTRYGSNIQVDAGLGYGPVDIMTTYR